MNTFGKVRWIMAQDKTFVPKGNQVSDWILVDAKDQGIGRNPLLRKLSGH